MKSRIFQNLYFKYLYFNTDFCCLWRTIKTDGTEDDEIFDYDNLMIDEDKENNGGSYMDSELAEEDGEEDGQDYNNWNEI
jgi:hypothetical protein